MTLQADALKQLRQRRWDFAAGGGLAEIEHRRAKGLLAARGRLARVAALRQA